MSNQDNQRVSAEASAEAPSVDRGRHDRGRRRHRNPPRHLERSINMNELRELIGLITENELTNFELEREGFRVRIARGRQAEEASVLTPAIPSMTESPVVGALTAPVQSASATPPAHPGALAEEAASEDQDLHIITSPIVGTFFRAPSPTAESFVRIGSQVEADTVVCIIEAMKLMNEIQAESSGEVVKIYVENGQAVEYGQPLFGIKT